MHPRSTRPSSALLLLALGAAGAALAAPSVGTGGEAPTFGEVVDVQLVAIEVVATDEHGQAITDLAPTDFSVFEDGAPVTLDHVELVRRGAATPAASGAAATASTPGEESPPAHVAVFIDEVHVSASSRLLLMSKLAESLRTGLGPRDPVMVAAYDGSTRVVLPFTTDRKALTRAFDELETVSMSRLIADNDWRSTAQALFDDAGGHHGWSPCLHIQEYVDQYSQQQSAQVGRAIDAFGGFVDSLAGIVGRKAVLHVSDGIPVRPGAEASVYAQELCNGVAPSQGTGDANFFAENHPDIYDAAHRTMEANLYDTSSRWEEIAARANAGNVSIYTFQAGLTPDLAPPSDQPQVRPSTAVNSYNKANRQESLFVLADRSGGRAFLDGGDLGPALASTLDELSSYYLLTYTPRSPGGEGVRQVRVDVTRPGVVTRYRKVYRPRTPHEQVADQLVGRLLYAPPGEASPLALALVSRQPAANGKAKARFRLEVPLASLTLTEQNGLRQGLFTAFVAVADERGLASSVREARVPVRVAPASAETPQRFVWEVEMQLRPGAHDVALAVRDEVSGDTSFIVRRFELAK